MRRWIILSLTIIGILCILLVIFFVINPKTTLKSTVPTNQSSSIPEISFEPLLSKLQLMKTSDGGYGYLAEEAKNIPDLYNTY